MILNKFYSTALGEKDILKINVMLDQNFKKNYMRKDIK